MKMNNVEIPNQSMPQVENEAIKPKTNKKYFRRYVVRKYNNKFYEVNKSTYDRVKNSPFFDTIILNWYIRGTKEFVRSQNEDELDRADNRLRGIKRIIVNPLQFYKNDTG